MRSKKFLIGLLTAGAALSTASAVTGCAGEASYVVETESAPPPPREEVVVYRPGHVWVHGHWNRYGRNDWRWRSGYYERERPNMVYTRGHWDRRGRSYVWIEGEWRPRASVTVRGRL
jgi:hypothetical protein